MLRREVTDRRDLVAQASELGADLERGAGVVVLRAAPRAAQTGEWRGRGGGRAPRAGRGPRPGRPRGGGGADGRVAGAGAGPRAAGAAGPGPGLPGGG